MLTQTNFLTRINDFKAFFVKTRNKTTYDYFSDDSTFNEKATSSPVHLYRKKKAEKR